MSGEKLVGPGTITKLNLHWDIKNRIWWASFRRLAPSPGGTQDRFILGTKLEVKESGMTMMDAFLALISKHGEQFNIVLDEDMAMIDHWKDRRHDPD